MSTVEDKLAASLKRRPAAAGQPGPSETPVKAKPVRGKPAAQPTAGQRPPPKMRPTPTPAAEAAPGPAVGWAHPDRVWPD
ncbi:MAG: hypothetical protein ACOZB0_10925 [Pseudomonadota bacterium]